MGGVVSYVMSFVAPSPPPLDTTPDPKTGLTPRDRQIITQTWSLVANKSNLKENAVEFFILFFTTYPHLKDFFVVFKSKSVAEIRTSSTLRSHATSVFYTLTSYVENLDDPETLVGLIQKIAISHYPRGITDKEFQELKTLLLKFLKSKLGSKCTSEVETAWNRLLTTHNAVIQATREELSRK